MRMQHSHVPAESTFICTMYSIEVTYWFVNKWAYRRFSAYSLCCIEQAKSGQAKRRSSVPSVPELYFISIEYIVLWLVLLNGSPITRLKLLTSPALGAVQCMHPQMRWKSQKNVHCVSMCVGNLSIFGLFRWLFNLFFLWVSFVEPQGLHGF